VISSFQNFLLCIFYTRCINYTNSVTCLSIYTSIYLLPIHLSDCLSVSVSAHPSILPRINMISDSFMVIWTFKKCVKAWKFAWQQVVLMLVKLFWYPDIRVGNEKSPWSGEGNTLTNLEQKRMMSWRLATRRSAHAKSDRGLQMQCSWVCLVWLELLCHCTGAESVSTGFALYSSAYHEFQFLETINHNLRSKFCTWENP
jgi:hypothetical protein